MNYYIFAANWGGQQDSVRVIVCAKNKQEALDRALEEFPGFYYTQCIEAKYYLHA